VACSLQLVAILFTFLPKYYLMTSARWLLPALILLSCTTACRNRSADSVVKDNKAAHTLAAPETSVTGTWCGMFEPAGNVRMLDKVSGDSIPVPANKITLFIDQMEDGAIFGYSVCAGNDRPFRGTYTEEGDKITATLKEPGDNKYDGVFELVISKEPLSVNGKWTPNNHAQSGRRYTLARKNFAYYATAGQYTESSVKLLTTDDVNNLYKDELRLMRNEIYARHGYAFKLHDMRELFDNQDWYMPVSVDVRRKLTPTELKNEKIIKQFEKYAEENYDDYGR